MTASAVAKAAKSYAARLSVADVADEFGVHARTLAVSFGALGRPSEAAAAAGVDAAALVDSTTRPPGLDYPNPTDRDRTWRYYRPSPNLPLPTEFLRGRNRRRRDHAPCRRAGGRGRRRQTTAQSGEKSSSEQGDQATC